MKAIIRFHRWLWILTQNLMLSFLKIHKEWKLIYRIQKLWKNHDLKSTIRIWFKEDSKILIEKKWKLLKYGFKILVLEENHMIWIMEMDNFGFTWTSRMVQWPSSLNNIEIFTFRNFLSFTRSNFLFVQFLCPDHCRREGGSLLRTPRQFTLFPLSHIYTSGPAFINP